jgi:peptidyl-prolyl cis-trans isomerase D
MLDVIRKNAQSWMVKVLFGLIVVVFVFWGVGSFRGGDSSVVATVNDTPILARDYIQAYERTAKIFQQQNPGLKNQDLERFGIKQQVLDQLIDAQLIAEKATAWGISISPAELRSEIANIPVFLNESKRFDPERYVAVLQENQLTPHRFEADFTHSLLMEKMREYVQSSSMVSESQARDFFDFALEKVRMDYLLFSTGDYLDRVVPTEEQILAYYQSHQDDFAVPERIALRYVLISPQTVAALQTVAPEEIRAFYEKNMAAFRQQEQVKARHILIKVDEAAPQKMVDEALGRIVAIRQDIVKGKDFAAMAAEHSEDSSRTQGGDLGWFSRGQMIEEFENAAFSLEPGKVSEPVRTLFGFHLIAVEDRHSERTLTLEESSGTIRQQLAEEKAIEGMTDLLDQIMVQVASGKDLEGAAATVGLETRRTALFSKQEGPRDFALQGEDVDLLFGLGLNKVTDSPFVLEDGYLLAEKVETQPMRIEPLESVETAIVRTLKQEGARKIAAEEAEKTLTEVKSGGSVQMTALTTTEPFGRSGIVPGLGPNQELIDAVFATRDQEWLSRSFQVEGGVLLARLNDRSLPEQEEWEQQKSFWISSLKELRAEELFRSFIENLRQEAQIRIVNPEFLSTSS